MTELDAHLAQMQAEHDTHWALVRHFLERALNGKPWEIAERDSLLELLDGNAQRARVRFHEFGRTLKGAEQKRYRHELNGLQQSFVFWTAELQKVMPAEPAPGPVLEGYNHPQVAEARRSAQLQEQRDAIRGREDLARLQQEQIASQQRIIDMRTRSHYANQQRWRESPWPGEDRSYCPRCGRSLQFGPCHCY